jgi:hypothetical protein
MKGKLSSTRLQTIAERLQNVSRSLLSVGDSAAVSTQLDHIVRRLQAHSQNPLTSRRQHTIICHELAAAAHWLHHLVQTNNIPARRLTPLQQEIADLITIFFDARSHRPERRSSLQPAPTKPSQPVVPVPEEPAPPHEDSLLIPTAPVSQPTETTGGVAGDDQIVEIVLDNQTYTWHNNHWRDDQFLTPPKTIIKRLNPLLEAQLASSDQENTDIGQLVQMARDARDNGQYGRAVKLARRIMQLQPDNHMGPAVLSAALRAWGKSELALKETDAFRHTGNTALLNSRAAAYCDLGMWEEAKETVGRSLAIAASEEAFLIVNRIKSVRPNLYWSP